MNTTPGFVKVHVIGASAGTGKTTRLAREYLRVFGKNEKQAAGLGVIATTFTRKSAEELLQRVRQMLFDRGQWIVAQSLLCGYAGTVHSIAVRLLRDYALESGLSPIVDVIDEQRRELIFTIAAEPALEIFSARTSDAVARFGWTEWRTDVLRACYLTMENNLDSNSLETSAKQSRATLLRLLPSEPDSRAAEEIDILLESTIANTIARLDNESDTTLETRKCRARLREMHHSQKTGMFTWADWAVCTKLKSGARSKGIVNKVIEVAALHPHHPRLREDLTLLISEFFQCLESAVALYQQYKRERGLVDFCDLERQALQLMANEEAKATLSSQLRLLLVDEFQDTSPLQMELFKHLAALSAESVWVGDEKQTIYGFRGADPALVETAVNQLCTRREQLQRSYRSRSELVALVNDLFSIAFPSIGISKDNVLISEVHRSTRPELAPALNVWWLEGKSWTEACASIAHSVSNLLRNETLMNVEDRSTGQLRPLIGSDIAILCLTNERCVEVAKALSAEGLSVASERPGLLSTAEASLAFACLRYMADPADSLAAAEIVHFRGNEWLNDWLEHGREYVEKDVPELARLRQGTSRLSEWTPQEALDFALTAGGVLTAVKQWTNIAQRISNLDALRGLAWQYEEVCKIQRSGCTAAGLIAFLYNKVEDGGAQPTNPDPKAIRVVTYHGSKGLEWPVVILLDLQEPKEANLFGVSVESDSGKIAHFSPLRNRWLRFWPWPYGSHSTNVHLDATAASSSEMARANKRRTAELIRLLYVGMTRARDYLYFAARAQRSDTGWLDMLKDSENKQLLSIQKEQGTQTLLVNGKEHKFEVSIQGPREDDENRIKQHEIRPVFSGIQTAIVEPRKALPLRLVPSSQEQTDEASGSPSEAKKVSVISIGNRLPLAGAVDVEHLGEVIHRFITADNMNFQLEERIVLATELMKRWSISQLERKDLLLLSSRLEDFISNRFGTCKKLKECPVVGRVGLQRVSGRIDMLIETEAGFVVLDHKSFPGPYNHWIKKALSYSKQLDLYSTLVTEATGKPVIEKLIHMPVVGKILTLKD
ncbi:MAG: UvrD-helicase domain-containing protein [Candidatus Obscuribacterales bacterium]|nr:UvrD-helicase domain-containing protein [Candidatus Obscuribacterales bacterium]